MRWTIVGSGYFLTFMVSGKIIINIGLEGTSWHGFWDNLFKYNIPLMSKVQQMNVGVFTQVWTKIFQDLVETQLKPSKLPEFQTLWVYIDHLFLKQFLNLNLNFYLFQVYDFNGQYVFGVLRFCLSLFEDLDSIYHNFLSY